MNEVTDNNPVRAIFHSLVGRAEGLLDWFIEEPVRRDPEEARRARLVVATALALALVDLLVLLVSDWAPWTSTYGIPLPRASIVGIMATIPINLSIAYVVKRTQTSGSATILLPTSLIVMVSYIATSSGGFLSPMTWWLSAVPLFGAFSLPPQHLRLNLGHRGDPLGALVRGKLAPGRERMRRSQPKVFDHLPIR